MLIDEEPKVKNSKQQITKLDLEIRAIIQDIERCRGPLTILDDLNTVIGEKLQELRYKIKEFEFLGREQLSETKKVIISKDAVEFKNQFLNIQTQLRKANVTCQLAIEKDCKEALFSKSSKVVNTVMKPKSSGNMGADVGMALNVTQNMMSLTRRMADQVKHIERANTTLISSSQQIISTHEELKNVSGHIKTSKKLLVKYERREFTDKLLILITLVFFFASVLYIIKKRLF